VKPKVKAMALKPLATFNAERAALIRRKPATHNGIECPVCQEQLFDTDLSVTLTTDPPQTRVHCNECNYTGTRLL